MVGRTRKKMEIKERLEKMFEGETNPDKLKELAEIYGELDKSATESKQLKDDNIKLSKMYVDAVKGKIDTSKPQEDPNATPSNKKALSLDEAFNKVMSDLLKEKEK